MEDKTNKYSILKVAINLTLACLISGVIIAITYYFTNPIAVANSIKLTNASMKALVQDADSFKKVDGKEGWYSAEKNYKPIAYIVPSENKGYGGVIKLLVAVTPEGKVINYTILSHNETPGLGDNTGKDKFKKQFVGKEVKNLVVVKDSSDQEDIQAITGATISSKAVTAAVKKAATEVLEVKGAK